MKVIEQKGFTLIELMIGLLVGLIVLSGVLYTFITLLGGARDISNSSKLNREASMLDSLISGELRRTGYWPPDGSSGSSPYSNAATPDLVIAGLNDECIMYSYMNNAVSPAVSVARGIAYDAVSKSVLYGAVSASLSSCTTTGWTEIMPQSTLSIDSMRFTLNCEDFEGNTVSPADCSLTNYAGLSREVVLDFTASIKSDNDWNVTVQSTVNIPNDSSSN